MTKKDGDKLRKMHTDLQAMREVYETGSDTEIGLKKVGDAIAMALAGRGFRIVAETTRIR